MSFFAGVRRRRVSVECFDKDKDGKRVCLTKQSDLEACDIRNILKRFRKTGLVSHLRTDGFFADVSEAPDFLAAMNVVAKAQQQFEALPSSLRDRFNNSPEKFMDFVHDPENGDELVKLGIRDKPKPAEPAPPPMKVEIVNPQPVSETK